MTVAWIFTCLLGSQQLSVAPPTVPVGEPATVRVVGESEPAVGVHIVREGPDGERSEVGVSDEHGQLRVTFDEVGRYVLRAEIEGVRCLAPIAVVPERRGWLLAIGSVPLGLALLWWNLRRMSGRARDAATG